MTTLRRFCLGLLLVSVGATLPSAAYANEATSAAEPSQLSVSISRNMPLDVEERLAPTQGESLTYEHTFVGYENEVVVAYWEDVTSNRRYYGAGVALYGADGQLLDNAYYPSDIVLEELGGRNRAYRLPATGEYRFEFTVPAVADTAETDAAQNPEYLLRLRVASFYERAMMLAVGRLDDEQYEESRAGFELAIAQRPESPMPYLGRLVSVGGSALEASGMTEMEIFSIEGVYALFQSLEPDEQSLVIADIEKIVQTGTAAIESGVVDADSLDLDLPILVDIAEYFKTGEVSEALREMVE